ncbi:von Willebrand factor type A domain-containing protein [Candidatus Uabimicrobium sp. HlEnr_7]|uniref:YfbK domain-containing protein n=1 Tax=Candidatus Uabimicrobium helgolandensis TaxID=3095367 RepID=UPI003558CB0B
MNCGKFHAYIYDYYYDLLENEERNEFEQHLQSCYECKEKFEQQQAGLSLLQAWQPQEEVQVVDKVVPMKSKYIYWRAAAIFFFVVSAIFSMLFVQQHNELSHFSAAESNYQKNIKHNDKQLKELQATYQRVSESYEKAIAEEEEKQHQYMQKIAKEQNKHAIEIEQLEKKNIQLSKELKKQSLLSKQEQLHKIKRLETKAKELTEIIPLYRVGSIIRRRKEKELAQVVAEYQSETRYQHEITKASQELEKYIQDKENFEEQQLVLQTELNNALGEILEKEKIIKNQQREVLEAKRILRIAEKAGAHLGMFLSKKKPLDGIVTAVSRRKPLVMLSLGSDDGVLKEYKFTISRGSKYIGMVVVVDVYKDACAAQIIKEKTLVKIKKGDSATTHFGIEHEVSKEKHSNKNKIRSTKKNHDVSKEKTLIENSPKKKQIQKLAKISRQELEDQIVAKESSEEERLILQRELNNVLAEVSEKEKIIQKQQRELLEAKQIISAAEKQGVRLDLLYTKKKPLDGFITAVSKKLPLVMLSLGSDDKVLKGYQFTIYREAKYVGAVIVEEVYKDACAARIIKEKTRIKVKKGDSVTTRFGGTHDVFEQQPSNENEIVKNTEEKSGVSKEKTLNNTENNTTNNTDSIVFGYTFSGKQELEQAREKFLPNITSFNYKEGWGKKEFEELILKGDINVDFPQEWRNAKNRKKARSVLDYMANNSKHNTEAYAHIEENPFIQVLDDPLSTFSIDVDTASYSNIRRFLNDYQMPPKDSIRLEEMINYFDYDYPQPLIDTPFSVHTEMANCPWNPKNVLLKVGLQGRKISEEKRPASNIVFLIDVSGSMESPKKLELLKKSFGLMIDNLTKNDRVAIVVYAGASGLVLPSTTCDNKNTIFNALKQLQAGGSTNGGQGIELAYKIAQQNYVADGINRVILATDGDFNIGITDEGSLTRLIEEKAKTGVFLTVLGFGMGNYKDSTLETLADKGNGNYGYIDNINEAQKMLVKEMQGTLWTIAKDVKIQIEFNPSLVESYRLVGYENRKLRHQDFSDDTKDAGEIGVGHRVTAFYEITPAYNVNLKSKVKPLRYQQKVIVNSSEKELAFIKLRYKEPKENKSKLLQFAINKDIRQKPSPDFLFASSVVSFGMLLRDSQYKGVLNYDIVDELAQRGAQNSKSKHRQEFLQLIKKARLVDQVITIKKNK